MIYSVKINIIEMLRHTVDAIQPFARSNYVGLSFEAKTETFEADCHPGEILPGLTQLLCRVITFTPSNYEVKCSIELPKTRPAKQLKACIENTGANLFFLKDTITEGLTMQIEVHPLGQTGTCFELSLPINSVEEDTLIQAIHLEQEGKEAVKVPTLYQKLRHRMRAYTISMQSLEEAVAREHSQKDQVFLKKANAIILANLDKETFDVRVLARSLGMSRTHLYRRLKPLIRQPPSHYIRFVRLQKAKGLLEKGEMTVGEVCFKVGFIDKSHFTRAFRQQFGFNPSYLRKQAK